MPPITHWRDSLTNGQREFRDTPIFESWTHPFSESHRTEAIQFLETQSGISRLSFLLRLDPEHVQGWERDNLNVIEQLNLTIDSNLGAFNRFIELWRRYGTQISPFDRPRILAETGQAQVQAPTDVLIKFLQMDQLSGEDSPLTGIVLGEPCMAPEGCKDAFQAAGAYNPGKNNDQVIETIRRSGSDEYSYIDSLGIDRLSEVVRNHPGCGKTIFCLDSGCDESHPALNQTVLEHHLFDPLSQYKEARITIDRGCHGSKVLGTILAREAAAASLNLPFSQTLRFGIASRAKAILINILDGGSFREGCPTNQIIGGLECVARSRRQYLNHVANSSQLWMGCDICNISIAPTRPLSNATQASCDKVISKLKTTGMAVILPSGNKGKHVGRVGSEGTYVGACDKDGKEWSGTREPYDILLPGKDLLLTQPPLTELGCFYVGQHSGTSFATGIMSGIVAVISEQTRRVALDVASALVATAQANNGRLNLDEAIRALS